MTLKPVPKGFAVHPLEKLSIETAWRSVERSRVLELKAWLCKVIQPKVAYPSSTPWF